MTVLTFFPNISKTVSTICSDSGKSKRIFVAGLRVWGSSTDRAYIRQDANLAVERMVRDLSEASEISTAKSDEVKFDADLDGDGIISFEELFYVLQVVSRMR